jgi:hypothetical protein
MQLPPLTFSDLSLLLVVGAIILLITAELASPHYGLTNLTINKKKLRNAALTIPTIPINSRHQNNQHNHRLKHKTRAANQSDKKP